MKKSDESIWNFASCILFGFKKKFDEALWEFGQCISLVLSDAARCIMVSEEDAHHCSSMERSNMKSVG